MAEGRYKLLVGKVRQRGWCGEIHPNTSVAYDSFHDIEHCVHEKKGKVGCLFDILADPGEHHDLALEMPDKAKEILAKMKKAENTWFNPNRGHVNPGGCVIADKTGFYQPWMP